MKVATFLPESPPKTAISYTAEADGRIETAFLDIQSTVSPE